MNECIVKKWAELDDNLVDEAIRVFSDGFLKEICEKTRMSTSSVERAIKHSFLRDHYYAALVDGRVTGVMATTTFEGRSHAFDKAVIQRELGYLRGWALYAVLRKELEKPMALMANECYIECLATATDY